MTPWLTIEAYATARGIDPRAIGRRSLDIAAVKAGAFVRVGRRVYVVADKADEYFTRAAIQAAEQKARESRALRAIPMSAADRRLIQETLYPKKSKRPVAAGR